MFTARFPTVPANAADFIDPAAYRNAIASEDPGPDLWQAWSIMLWLETP